MKRIVNSLGKFNCGKNVYAALALCAATAIALPGQTFTTLHGFDGTDGQNPYSGLVQAPMAISTGQRRLARTTVSPMDLRTVVGPSTESRRATP
jgi:hypothetical protein